MPAGFYGIFVSARMMPDTNEVFSVQSSGRAIIKVGRTPILNSEPLNTEYAYVPILPSAL
jgi:hypothetical protein